jgi:hypothetical protein
MTYTDRLQTIVDALDTFSRPLAICAWCPTFDKRDPANKGASHGICPACAKLLTSTTKVSK